MNIEMPEMRTGLAALSVLIAIVCGMAGCGGSGSSGFDITPSEAQTIAQAIDGGVCVDFEQQTYCASGVEPQTGLFVGASVIIEEPADPLVCDGEAAPADCTASLDFTTEGFMRVNSLLAAVSETERGPWTLVPLTAGDNLLGPHTVSIMVPGPADDMNPAPFIAAVLVYAGTPPETVPETAARLADFGTDLIYVSSRLEIVVPRVEGRAVRQVAPAAAGTRP
jgi:hypothetical protein